MKTINFVKMEGAGNDFIVIDLRTEALNLAEVVSLTPALCDRKFGIGADGLLALSAPSIEEADYTMIYRNADGSDAGMCGNGSRCLAYFAALNGFKRTHSFNVHDQVYHAKVDTAAGVVEVAFPPVQAPKKLTINKKPYIQVYPGTEHVVSFVPSERLDDEDSLVEEGQLIRRHPLLDPPGTNVNFVYAESVYEIDLQTYERGVEDLTLACGTGAIASAIATHFLNSGDSTPGKCQVLVKGGLLEVSYTFNKDENYYEYVSLKGPARLTFRGEYDH